MIVVGGAYNESVVVPAYGPVPGGSAIRAAHAVGADCEGLLVALAADEKVHPDLESVTRIFERNERVSFDYYTPISTPRITGQNAIVPQPIHVDADSAVVFGMVERVDLTGKVRRLVVDPQSPKGDSRGSNTITADERVLSANAREVANLLEHPTDNASNAEAVRAKYGYSAVVLRAAAQGCFVATETSLANIAAHPTMSVWSLGSGDTFSGEFAAAWSHGADPIEAAEIASNATAWWCETRIAPTPDLIRDGSRTFESIQGRPDQRLVGPGYAPRVYLGGPFFSLSERWLVDLVKPTLEGLGARPFSPLHHVGHGGDGVAKLDIGGLEKCDSMLALLDHYDPGTLYEAGWAAARGMPIVAYRTNQDDEGDKMLIGLGAEIHSDLTTALYRAVWAAQGADIVPGRYFQKSPE